MIQIYYIDISNAHVIATADNLISDEALIFNLVFTVQKHSSLDSSVVKHVLKD